MTAIKDFDKALDLQPNLAIVYRNRGDARKAKGDMAGAIADYGKEQRIKYATSVTRSANRSAFERGQDV